MPSKVWDEITYPFPNFNGVTVEVWEWISNFIPHFIWLLLLSHAGLNLNHVSKRDPWFSMIPQTMSALPISRWQYMSPLLPCTRVLRRNQYIVTIAMCAYNFIAICINQYLYGVKFYRHYELTFPQKNTLHCSKPYYTQGINHGWLCVGDIKSRVCCLAALCDWGRKSMNRTATR